MMTTCGVAKRAQNTHTWNGVTAATRKLIGMASTEKHYGVGKRECSCGSEHTPEWWDGYEAGREDGFDEGAQWSGTWCEVCCEPH